MESIYKVVKIKRKQLVEIESSIVAINRKVQARSYISKDKMHADKKSMISKLVNDIRGEQGVFFLGSKLKSLGLFRMNQIIEDNIELSVEQRKEVTIFCKEFSIDLNVDTSKTTNYLKSQILKISDSITRELTLTREHKKIDESYSPTETLLELYEYLFIEKKINSKDEYILYCNNADSYNRNIIKRMIYSKEIFIHKKIQNHVDLPVSENTDPRSGDLYAQLKYHQHFEVKRRETDKKILTLVTRLRDFESESRYILESMEDSMVIGEETIFENKVMNEFSIYINKLENFEYYLDILTNRQSVEKLKTLENANEIYTQCEKLKLFIKLEQNILISLESMQKQNENKINIITNAISSLKYFKSSYDEPDTIGIMRNMQYFIDNTAKSNKFQSEFLDSLVDEKGDFSDISCEIEIHEFLPNQISILNKDSKAIKLNLES